MIVVLKKFFNTESTIKILWWEVKREISDVPLVSSPTRKTVKVENLKKLSEKHL